MRQWRTFVNGRWLLGGVLMAVSSYEQNTSQGARITVYMRASIVFTAGYCKIRSSAVINVIPWQMAVATI